MHISIVWCHANALPRPIHFVAQDRTFACGLLIGTHGSTRCICKGGHNLANLLHLEPSLRVYKDSTASSGCRSRHWRARAPWQRLCQGSSSIPVIWCVHLQQLGSLSADHISTAQRVWSRPSVPEEDLLLSSRAATSAMRGMTTPHCSEGKACCFIATKSEMSACSGTESGKIDDARASRCTTKNHGRAEDQCMFRGASRTAEAQSEWKWYRSSSLCSTRALGGSRLISLGSPRVREVSTKRCTQRG